MPTRGTTETRNLSLQRPCAGTAAANPHSPVHVRRVAQRSRQTPSAFANRGDDPQRDTRPVNRSAWLENLFCLLSSWRKARVLEPAPAYWKQTFAARETGGWETEENHAAEQSQGARVDLAAARCVAKRRSESSFGRSARPDR